MKLPDFIKSNLILKITSVNSTVIVVRLVIALFVQRILAVTIGEVGIARIGQLRNVMAMLMSITTLGVGNGIIKYVAEYKSEQKTLSKVFSSALILVVIGCIISAVVLLCFSESIAVYLFGTESLKPLIKIIALAVPFIALHRVFNSIISGLSDYKSYAKVDLFAYILATIVLLVALYYQSLNGVLFAIALTPIIQLGILMMVFGKTLKEYLVFKQLTWSSVYLKPLLAFTIMSFVSTFLINTVELDIRTQIGNKINLDEAGYWTGLTFISKNYMVFISGILSLYVLPKFASIKTESAFKSEVRYVYKTILPLFAIGMILIYIFRNLIIDLIYPNFLGMSPLFKWQLLGDFFRLMALILTYQFLAKRMVKSFVFTELVSLVLFYVLSLWLINDYGTEGVVIAHFVRYILYFMLVFILVWFYYQSDEIKHPPTDNL